MPILSLNCMFMDKLTSFSIDILSTHSVDQLKEAINTKLPYGTPVLNLTLWKASISIDAPWYQKDRVCCDLHEGNSLDSAQPLNHLFPQGVPQDEIHIIVRWQCMS